MSQTGTFLTQLNVTPRKWLALPQCEKDTLITLYLRNYNAAGVSPTDRQALIHATDQDAQHAAVYPAGDAGDTTPDLTFNVDDPDVQAVNNQGSNSGLDSKFWQAFATGGFAAATAAINAMSAGDQARIRQQALASLNASNNPLYRQQLSYLQGLGNNSMTMTYVVLGAGILALGGGIWYASSKKRNPTRRHTRHTRRHRRAA